MYASRIPLNQRVDVEVWECGEERETLTGSIGKPPGIASTQDTAEREGEGECVDEADEGVNMKRWCKRHESTRTAKEEKKIVRVDGGEDGA